MVETNRRAPKSNGNAGWSVSLPPLRSRLGVFHSIAYIFDMAVSAAYLPKYAASRALVIGINKYQSASPLLHASNDATAVAQLLTERFGFPKENVILLMDAGATRAAILQSFLSYANSGVVSADDRILIFYAGHGHTLPSRRGDTGFLVPVDGKTNDLASLIRWDELTRYADLIPAKHMLFLMDACYGGTRADPQEHPAW